VRKKIINWLQSKFHFVIRNDADLKEMFIYKLSNFRFILISFILLLSFFTISFYLSTTALRYWFDPRFVEQLANQQVINLSQTVDSLINESTNKDNYINNIKSILQGKENIDNTLTIQNNKLIDTLYSRNLSIESNSIDSLFRRQFEESNNNYFNENMENNFDEILNVNLFSPVSSGIISSKYDISKKHYGIDILCNKDEPIKAIADGTVILSSWTKDSGYIISIYHSNNLVSIYKHNSKLLRNVGDNVSTGDIISIIGNTGELSSGPHLHLELWFNGKSINPSQFVSF
tara:strand:+ start:4332 stop:5198 length:867 start_codon:yes stop_codon:yes gene_type:complete